MKTLFLFTITFILATSSSSSSSFLSSSTQQAKNLGFFWGSDPTLWDTNYGKLGTILQCTNSILGFYHTVSLNLVFITMWALTIGFYGTITYTSMTVISYLMAAEVYSTFQSYEGFKASCPLVWTNLKALYDFYILPAN